MTVAASAAQDDSSSSALCSSTTASSSVANQQQLSDTKNYQWTKQNLAIALPALMGLLADPVLSMVDTAFVGRMSTMDLAALGVCTSIFHMSFTVFRAMTVATTSLVGMAKTQTEKREITKISLQLAGVVGSLVLLALRFGGPALLATMGVPATSPLYKPAKDYLFARCWAAPAVVGSKCWKLVVKQAIVAFDLEILLTFCPCLAFFVIQTVVVAEGAFRGNDDSKTPFVASSFAAFLNLILDPILMFPLGFGMAGAAVATAVSQLGAAGIYGWRLWKRKLLPQKNEKSTVDKLHVIKQILGANLAMLSKQGSNMVFYTIATALATRMGPAHVAAHQCALTLFWLSTYWLDSGSISAQVLMAKNIGVREKAISLSKYMAKYALLQGLALSTIVAGVGKFLPGAFTRDATVCSLLLRCLPHLAFQQTLVSLTLILEALTIGGNQFRYMALGTAAATVVGVYQLFRATSVVGIWSTAVNTFFGCRLLLGLIGVARVHKRLGEPKMVEDAKAVPSS